MNRFRIDEFSFERILRAAQRRVAELPHEITWHFPLPIVLENRTYLEKFTNLHPGQRCFIIGNGPSISKMDLSPLAGEVTFGMNRIYLAFQNLRFVPTYYVCVNELLLEQFAAEIRPLPMEKFLNWNRRSLFLPQEKSTGFLKLSLAVGDQFNQNIIQPFYSGGTVTYITLQLAYMMGFSEVILIGVDHSFANTGTPNAVETRQEDIDPNHFHPDYFPKGSKWQFPDLRRSEMAYTLAREVFARSGRVVLDATVGGKCPVFERVAFASLF